MLNALQNCSLGVLTPSLVIFTLYLATLKTERTTTCPLRGFKHCIAIPGLWQ